MPPSSLRDRLPANLPFYAKERRKRLRFDMKLPVLLREMGNSWAIGETVNLSASGAYFVTNRPLLIGVVVEYVLTFPADLINAPQPLRVRFVSKVMRCERVPENSEAFGIAVSNKGHHYLSSVSSEESASYDAIEKQLSAVSSSAAAIPPL
jgi:PilZ domain-containing protein